MFPVTRSVEIGAVAFEAESRKHAAIDAKYQ